MSDYEKDKINFLPRLVIDLDDGDTSRILYSGRVVNILDLRFIRGGKYSTMHLMLKVNSVGRYTCEARMMSLSKDIAKEYAVSPNVPIAESYVGTNGSQVILNGLIDLMKEHPGVKWFSDDTVIEFMTDDDSDSIEMGVIDAMHSLKNNIFRDERGRWDMCSEVRIHAIGLKEPVTLFFKRDD